MSVQSGFFWDETFICASSASLVAAQFTAVSLTTSLVPAAGGVQGLPSVIAAANATQGVNGAIGVLQNDPKVLQGAIVRLLGTTKMVATTSAAVTYGALVTVNGVGQACVADTTGQQIVGRCIQASTGLVAGSLVEVLIAPLHSLGLV